MATNSTLATYLSHKGPHFFYTDFYITKWIINIHLQMANHYDDGIFDQIYYDFYDRYTAFIIIT